MRGKRRLLFVFHCFLRIIPAHAGQTRFSPRAAGHTSDHPRACGANGVDALWDKLKDGSSPRMRGKPVRCVVDIVVLRIIPAHAGQTPCDERERRSRTDHPRACGANSLTHHFFFYATGSSPRMRGKHVRDRHRPPGPRIIPAHAGQTPVWRGRALGITDHPRACGANAPAGTQAESPTGSSPRMRGKLPCLAAWSGRSRIIPAHAGQTQPIPWPRPPPSDHPRACGANSPVRSVVCATVGSSPRMRGKRSGNRPTIHLLRIIPAHAGQTWQLRQGTRRQPDHPRACGANGRVPEIAWTDDGSSPRMRGKHGFGEGVEHAVRIIPAHAGQTRPRSRSAS